MLYAILVSYIPFFIWILIESRLQNKDYELEKIKRRNE